MIVVIQCKDQVGLVAGITGVLAKEQLNIVSLREHVDKIENRFFIRVHLEQDTDPQQLEMKLKQVLPAAAMITVNPMPEKKIVVMVTKEYHCLGDILIRNYFKTLGAQVQCVIGNHDTLQNICQRFDIPFYLVSHEQKDKEAFEAQARQMIDKHAPDYIVLAKFMRILSPGFVAHYTGRIINIHHSFLPAFVGASPYRQAFERGVKLIGATAHFVTNELDEGPIIAQQIIPVTHSHTAADMMKAGKEIETAVLAKALQIVFEDRVLVYKNKTVVFE
ncbi:formyltetrahydrofolate deformylase [Niastella koreensis]|uniref:Formyltetrahydrofolate deformylase n=2 Tax=Niastella koreensis TaxID=354356 RepID=G8TR43_NIAKG|nr:formyltetrahydrofolate deformylase [Niastella koreensis]AEV98957.1 formyltetrahydrofolate deformylase [Niastella koreensis GR20-10]OQP43880.1 formyltetrahydrofolate deformylase [Niastella koreensis]